MKTTELIATARKCGDRTMKCKAECPMYAYDANCTTRLLNALADELEKANSTITVGAGENYKVVHK